MVQSERTLRQLSRIDVLYEIPVRSGSELGQLVGKATLGSSSRLQDLNPYTCGYQIHLEKNASRIDNDQETSSSLSSTT